MTTTKYSNTKYSRNCRRTSSLLRTILNNSFMNFSWAEAYMTYFIFDRCNINLCVRPSTNAFDVASHEYYLTISGSACDREIFWSADSIMLGIYFK